MRYVPNLISENHKVLPDYFKGNIYKATKKNIFLDVIYWIAGIFFFVGVLASFNRPVLFLLYGIIVTILIPPGHDFLQRTLKFRFVTSVRLITTAFLFVVSISLTKYYNNTEAKAAYEEKLAKENEMKAKALADRNEQQRKDSLDFYINKSKEATSKHNFDEANKMLTKASSFAIIADEKGKIEKEKFKVSSNKTFDIVKAGDYKSALTQINKLLAYDSINAELLFNRAICYSKLGKIQEAVNDLKPLIELGNQDAVSLHDKINPIRQRIAYYVTRCWDGTTSNSDGSGACSHHGGVKNWHEPVYEEYRKY